jgi:hypothetical protein
LQSEQNFAGVNIARQPVLEHAHIDQGAMIGLDRDGHVLVVDEQIVVRRGHLIGSHKFVSPQIVGRRKKVEQLGEIRHIGGKPGQRFEVDVWSERSSGIIQIDGQAANFKMRIHLPDVPRETFCPKRHSPLMMVETPSLALAPNFQRP